MSEQPINVVDVFYTEYNEHERYVSKGRVSGPIYDGGRMLFEVGRLEQEVDRSTLEDIAAVALAALELMGRDRV